MPVVVLNKMGRPGSFKHKVAVPDVTPKKVLEDLFDDEEDKDFDADALLDENEVLDADEDPEDKEELGSYDDYE